MARSSKKGPFVDFSLEKKIKKLKKQMTGNQSKHGQDHL